MVNRPNFYGWSCPSCNVMGEQMSKASAMLCILKHVEGDGPHRPYLWMEAERMKAFRAARDQASRNRGASP